MPFRPRQSEIFFDEKTLKGTLSPQKVFSSFYFLTFFVFDNDDMKSHVTFLSNVFFKNMNLNRFLLLRLMLP